MMHSERQDAEEAQPTLVRVLGGRMNCQGSPALDFGGFKFPAINAVHCSGVGRCHSSDRVANWPIATQAGQGAFAAIQEVVEILAADPKTDWSKVNIDALRQHLVDMDNVTLSANMVAEVRHGRDPEDCGDPGRGRGRL